MSERPSNFIRDIIDEDLRTGKHVRIVTRFPPEPNGYPHIGHAKAICLNFGLARDYGGVCNLRMDDTNPETEDMEYVAAFERDIAWLGFDWGGKLFYASDYFDAIHDHAVSLIERGLAYVDSSTEDEIRAARGSLTEPGRPTPGRARSVVENLDLFRRMRAGEFPDGAHVLRAKIDLAAANMKLRDPLLYRIRHERHYRTGDAWCIYPMYDYAHPLSDALEGITHSICTLEFENNRDIYDWVVENCPVTIDGRRARPRQYEMARLAVGYTVMSKRKLLKLVGDNLVDGWDDPRMPTISGMRRRGLPPEALRAFVEGVGVAKANSMVDVGKLEFAVRDHLNHSAPRAMCVLRPLPVTLSARPPGAVEMLRAPLYPPDVGKPGEREVPLARDIVIERDDFAETPPTGWKRLSPGGVVRLRYAGLIRCDEVKKDASGAVVELVCSAVEPKDAPKEVGTIHWVAHAGSVPLTARLYDRLFEVERPDDAADPKVVLNPRSLEVVAGALAEPSVGRAVAGDRFQFERVGYFAVDVASQPGALAVNRVVGLRDSWAKETSAPAAEPTVPRKKSAKAETRPDRASPLEVRAKARANDAALARWFERFQQLGVSEQDADLLTGEPDIARGFELVLRAGWSPDEAAKVFLNQFLAVLRSADVQLDEAAWRSLHGCSSEARKAFFARVGKNVSVAEALASLAAPSAMDLDGLLEAVLAAHAAEVARYRAGEQKLFNVLVGQAMKQAAGKADATALRELLKKKLET